MSSTKCSALLLLSWEFVYCFCAQDLSVINHFGFSKGSPCLFRFILNGLPAMKAFIKQRHCGHSRFKWHSMGISVEKALINATPSCHSRGGRCSVGWVWWVVGGGWWQWWHATGVSANGVSELCCQRVTQLFRAEIPLTHSSHSRAAAFVHKFPPNATPHCGIWIGSCLWPWLWIRL